ncbi:uncharacterized protein LOC142634524 [Castanea sativa]|uniref:uncharacterized protein LOC142634524 n=1 Tax=Castanea sativa TaxID=21020 RepID=UPI003F64B64D
MFNEINGNFDDVAIRMIKVGLPIEHGLRKSLTGKPVESVRQLIDRIDKYKRVEEDQQQGKGKANVAKQDGMRSREAQPKPSLPIPSRARTRHRRLQDFVESPRVAGPKQKVEVILVPTQRAGWLGRVKSPRKYFHKTTLGYNQHHSSCPREDWCSAIQGDPHDDALVVTLRIEGYDVKRVLMDQGSDAEIMYPDLYKGLKLRSSDLTCYDSSLIGFDRKIVFPKGQIQLPVQIRTEVVEVNFIMVDAYSLYTAIMARL